MLGAVGTFLYVFWDGIFKTGFDLGIWIWIFTPILGVEKWFGISISFWRAAGTFLCFFGISWNLTLTLGIS